MIANTFARLAKLHECVTEYVKPMEMTGEKPRAERRNDAVAAFNELKPYFAQNRLFLPKKAADQIEKANLELVRMSNQFTFMVDLPRQPDVQQWLKITERLDSDFKQALASLEDELRVAIGDKG